MRFPLYYDCLGKPDGDVNVSWKTAVDTADLTSVM